MMFATTRNVIALGLTLPLLAGCGQSGDRSAPTPDAKAAAEAAEQPGEPEILRGKRRTGCSPRGSIRKTPPPGGSDCSTDTHSSAGKSPEMRIGASKKGTIVVDSGEKCFLCTSTDWQDFELTLEFNADEKTNSGVFVRTPMEPDDPATDCYEINIAPDDNPFPTASIVKRQKVNDDAPQQAFGQWRRMNIPRRRQRSIGQLGRTSRVPIQRSNRLGAATNFPCSTTAAASRFAISA